MTQEDKNLLLRDLCARLPYGVKLCHESFEDVIILHTIDATQFAVEISIDNSNSNTAYWNSIEQVKPYLFPLSSMTEEQLYELREMFGFEIEFNNGFIELSTFHHGRLGYLEMVALFEWFNRNHFDYRGLIPKGSAIDCTNLNIY